MTTDALLYPLLAQVTLTVLILLLLVRRRTKAVSSGETDINYFKLFSGKGEPYHVAVVQRSFLNQFEMPVIFYVLILAATVFGKTGDYFLYAAWGYVALRTVHAIVHIAVNKVMWRFGAFLMSNLALMAMLVLLWLNV